MPRALLFFSASILFLLGLDIGRSTAAIRGGYASHPPMRAEPPAARRSLTDGPAYFVDAAKGNDAHDGSKERPWKTVAYASGKLQPGDTLYLRKGIYYERFYLRRSGTAAAPITIGAYPGETAIIDGGLREFYDDPAASWRPYAEGAKGEFVSTKVYTDADDRQVPHQFLPVAWEPFQGIETQRPIALGHFADSMVPLHGYRTVDDLRSPSELWPAEKVELDEGRPAGPYCGPGLWFNRETGRIHIRLTHHRLAGLGDRAYRGETDPRKLRLVIALGFGGDVLRINGIDHVRIRDLVLRGATGSPMIHVYGSQNVELDHLAVYGGFPALLLHASKDIRVKHTSFRGLAAPWLGRGHMKYRGTPSYQVIFQNTQPVNEDIEIAHCEFTDDHDCAFLRYVKNLQFHHNYVDNFNDDGLECGPKLRDHAIYVHHNRIGACLGLFQQHELDKDESPRDHDPRAGVFVYRNVLDSRDGVYRKNVGKDDPSGEFLHTEGVLLGDHSSPTFPVMRFYHNTVLRRTPAFRNSFLLALGTVGLRNTERYVYNNILVQQEGTPGTGALAVGHLQEGGNLLWGVNSASTASGEPFAKFRASKLFVESQEFFKPGWTTLDLYGDPRFLRFMPGEAEQDDLRLRPTSPARSAGEILPEEWPDDLRISGRPDIGALPHNVEPWGVGVEGRIPLFGTIREN